MMRLEPQVNTHPRLLREAALGTESAVKPMAAKPSEHQDAAPKKSKGKGQVEALEKPGSIVTEPTAESPIRAPKKPKQANSRFLGPVHLNERQKANICRSLKKKGVGDEMGRQIFVAAVEYQLSAFADHLLKGEVPKIKPPSRDRALDQILLAIEEQARVLSELLLQIPKPSMPDLARAISAQDGRDCDEHYLGDLGGEIDRLRRACNAMTSVAEMPVAEAGPDPDASLRFVRTLGGVFAECFEQEPTAAEDGAFRICLEVLDQVTDFAVLHEPDFLVRALGDRTAGSATP